MPPTDATERLQRVLSARGVESRRKAEALIRAGRVTVDGQTVTELGTKVDPRRARITVDGQALRPQRLRYLLLNKPTGYITTTDDERGRRTVMDLVNVPERVYPVGRLDRDTEGLLLLTNDGDVANRVMHPRYGLAKEYNVLTDRRPIEPVMERVRRGVTVDGKTVVPEEFRLLRETRDGILLTITLHEGTKHIVRRIMENVGIRVVRLRRVRIGPLSLAGIREGTYRELTTGELTTLFEALRISGADDRPLSAAGAKTGPPIRLRESRSRPDQAGARETSRSGTEGGGPNSGAGRGSTADRRRQTSPAPVGPGTGPADAPAGKSRRGQPTVGANPPQPAAVPGRVATGGKTTAGGEGSQARPEHRPRHSKATDQQPIADAKRGVRGRGRKLQPDPAPSPAKTSRHRSKSAAQKRQRPAPEPARSDDA